MAALDNSRVAGEMQFELFSDERLITCTDCNKTQTLDHYYCGTGGRYRHRCKSCTKLRVVSKRQERPENVAYESEHGFSVASCASWAIRRGLGHTPHNQETIGAYKLWIARVELIRLLRKVRDSKPKEFKSVPVDRSVIWDYYDGFGRMSLSQAWNDWKLNCPMQWFVDSQMRPPVVRFESAGEQYKWSYKNIHWFGLSERNRNRIKQKARGKLFKNIEKTVQGVCRRGDSGASLSQFIGYTGKQLSNHIESQFSGGMCWDRIDDIHIDHIVPCSLFDMSDESEVRACWALVNLQPLWSKDNLRKTSNLELDIISDELREHLEANAKRVHEKIYA